MAYAASCLGCSRVLVDPAPQAVECGVHELGGWLNWGVRFGGVNVTLGSLLGALLLLASFLAVSVPATRPAREELERVRIGKAGRFACRRWDGDKRPHDRQRRGA